jgi:hypothetical protein
MNFFTSKKIITLITTFLLCFVMFSEVSAKNVLYGTEKDCKFIENGNYKPFSDINQGFPVFGRLMDSQNRCINVSTKVNDMFAYGFNVFLGLVSLIAVVQVSIAGIQWMLQDTGANALGKSTAKQKLTNSIIGLVLALSGWLILNTVNPQILNANLNFGTGGGGPLGGFINRGINEANIKDVGTGGESLGEPGGADGAGTGTLGKPGGPTGGTTSGGVSKFKNQDWANYMRQKIETSGLNDLSPSDAAKFFPNGQPSTEGWLRVFEEVIERESSFNPNTKWFETKHGYNSVGLLQLSEADTIVKNKGYSEADLTDPYKNIDAGVDIFKFLVQRDGCISCGTKGGAAYWSVLRTPDVHENGKLDQIINAVNQ